MTAHPGESTVDPRALLLPHITPERAAEIVRGQFLLSPNPCLPQRLVPFCGTKAVTEHITPEQVDEALRELLERALEGLRP